MTLTHYAGRITSIIDEATHGAFVYPDDFDTHVETRARNRASPDDVAREIMAPASEPDAQEAAADA